MSATRRKATGVSRLSLGRFLSGAPRSPSSARGNGRRFDAERLEPRRLLAGVSWTDAQHNGLWTDPLNWMGGSGVPTAADDVTIPPGFNTISIDGGMQAAHSLTIASPLQIPAASELDVTTTAAISANLTLAGGTLKGATVSTTNGASLLSTGNGGTLDGVALNSSMSVTSSPLVVVDGLTLGGAATLTIAAGVGFHAQVFFQGIQTLGGTGQVRFGGATDYTDYFYVQSVNNTQSTLTVGSGITIHGGNTGIGGATIQGYEGNGKEALINQGIINSDVPGATLSVGNQAAVTNSSTLEAASGGLLLANNLTNSATVTVGAASAVALGGSWSNAGTINLNGASLYLGGNFTTAGVGTINRTSGSVNLTGTLDSSGTTLALTAATGSWNLLGGTIHNGTVTTTGGASLILAGNGGTLDGVTLGSDLAVTSIPLTILNGLTLNGGVTLSITAGINYHAQVFFRGIQFLGGTGQVLFGGATDYNDSLYVQSVNNTQSTLSIGSGVSIHGGNTGAGGAQILGYQNNGMEALINQGTINSDVSGATLSLGANQETVTNSGTLKATGGGLLAAQNVSNLSGGTLTGGDWQAFSNSKLTLPASVTTIAANVLLNGAGSIITSSGGVSNALAGLAAISSGGSLSLQGGQSLSATPAGGAFTSHGNLTLGAGSHLSVAGGFMQAADGTLAVQISGPTSASFGQLTATGTATAGGALQATLGGGYDPALGQSFAIMTGASEVGTFSTFTGAITPGGRAMAVGYTATTATITIVAAPAPTLTGTQIDDGNRQRSLVRSLKFTFSTPVTLSAGAITLALLNTGGSGANDGSAPTDASIALGTPTSSDGGFSWVIPIKTSSTFSAFGSLLDGIYTATVHASLVTDGFGHNLSGGDQTKTFHRLYGDINGDKKVSNADFATFALAFGSTFGQSNYNPYFDITNSNAKISNADFTQFANRFNKQFVYTA